MWRDRSILSPALLSLALFSLAGACTASAQTYDLRGPVPGEGTVLQTRIEVRAEDSSMTIEQGGTVLSGESGFEQVEVSELEVVQTDGDGVRIYRKSLPESWTRTTFELDGSAAQTSTEDSALVGETVLLERQDDGWRQALVGREPSPKQKHLLEALFVEARERFPVRPLPVGESWEIEGARLAALLGMGNALSADGEATFTFERVVEKEGDRLAVISYRLEVRARVLGESRTPIDVSMGGSGTIQRSLKSHRNVSERFRGEQELAFSLVQEGRRSTHRQVGPIEVEESQRWVKADGRARLVRRGGAGQDARPAVGESRAEKSRTTAPPAQAGSCTGTAVPCSVRSAFQCGGPGCSSSGTCAGFPSQTCFGKGQFSCQATSGCFWNAWSSSCGGVLTCAGKPSFACGATPGCFWQPGCSGSATPCFLLGAQQCTSQPGCRLE